MNIFKTSVYLITLIGIVSCKPEGAAVFKFGDVAFYNEDLVEWSTGVDPDSGYFLNIKFNSHRDAEILKMTQDNIGKPIKTMLCGRLISEPIARTPIGVASFGLFGKESYANATACLDSHKKLASP